VNVTWQLATPPEPVSVQGLPLKVSVVTVLLNLTAPVGVSGVGEVSVTVAVHLVDDSGTTTAGWQLSLVTVGRLVTADCAAIASVAQQTRNESSRYSEHYSERERVLNAGMRAS
jgi:hypothetical protein